MNTGIRCTVLISKVRIRASYWLILIDIVAPESTGEGIESPLFSTLIALISLKAAYVLLSLLFLLSKSSLIGLLDSAGNILLYYYCRCRCLYPILPRDGIVSSIAFLYAATRAFKASLLYTPPTSYKTTISLALD